MKRLLYLAPVALFAMLLGAFVAGLGRDPAELPSTLIDRPLPNFVLPALRAGDPPLRSDQLTGEPRLLNVFASWCVSCRFEHPVLLALKKAGVPIVGLDWKDEPAAGAAYLARGGDPYRVVGNDSSGRAGIDLGVAGVPETFVLDRAGRVRAKIIGPISPDDWRKRLAPLMHRLAARAGSA